MTIKKICRRDTITITDTASVFDAAKLMRKHHIGALVVIDSAAGVPQPIGIVTDRDIVIELVAKEVPLDSVTVGDIMSSNPLIAKEDDSIRETIEQMRIKGVRRMPVVDARKSLVGIITVDDLLELVSDELASLGYLMRREQKQEMNKRPNS
jgi:CBS domain-containing protein